MEQHKNFILTEVSQAYIEEHVYNLLDEINSEGCFRPFHIYKTVIGEFYNWKEAQENMILLQFLTDPQSPSEEAYGQHLSFLSQAVLRHTGLDQNNSKLRDIWPKIETWAKFEKHKRGWIQKAKQSIYEVHKTKPSSFDFAKKDFILFTFNFYIFLNEQYLGDVLGQQSDPAQSHKRNFNANNFLQKFVTDFQNYALTSNLTQTNNESSALVLPRQGDEFKAYLVLSILDRAIESIREAFRVRSTANMASIFEKYHSDYNESIQKFMQMDIDLLVPELQRRGLMLEKAQNKDVNFDLLKTLKRLVEKIGITDFSQKSYQSRTVSKGVYLCCHGWLQSDEDHTETWNGIPGQFQNNQMLQLSWPAGDKNDLIAQNMQSVMTNDKDQKRQETLKHAQANKPKGEVNTNRGFWSKLVTTALKIGEDVTKTQVKSYTDIPGAPGTTKSVRFLLLGVKNLDLGKGYLVDG